VGASNKSKVEKRTALMLVPTAYYVVFSSFYVESWSP